LQKNDSFCKKIENSELTNAGFGGNLTETGRMETEAGFSFSESTNESVTKTGFGAASCITNCQNPIRIAANIAIKNSDGVDTNGRVPPLLLTGSAADRLVITSGMKDLEQKVSKRAKRTYDKYSEMISTEPEAKRIKPSSDTVGGVVAHINQNRSFLASASSSGGLLLKKDGRVGSAATVGAGFFCNSNFASTCSGTGEQIILHGSARLACRLGFECIDDLMNDFISEESIQNDATKSLGIVRLEKRTDSLLISFAHTTPGMNIVIQSSHSKKPEIFFSKNNDTFTAVSHKIPLKL